MPATANHPPQPRPIPTPVDFPVQWQSPEEAHLPWTLDPMHFPGPLPTLEGELWCRLFHYGFNPAQAAYEIPIRAHARQINAYHYEAMVPAVPPEQMETQGHRAQEKLVEAISRLDELWEREWLPEIQEHLAFWDSFDLERATGPQLLGHLDQTVARIERLWEVHFRIVLAAYAAISQFDDLYRDLFGGEGTFDPYQLLQGFDNKTLETNQALWDLSRKALLSPRVRQVLEASPSAEILRTLEVFSEGQTFLAELRAYLETYGQRGPTWSISLPGWVEDPTPAIDHVKNYLLQPDGDPRVRLTALAAQREQAVAQARQRVQGYPQPVREQFEFLLKAAQKGVVLSEDHGFWIDFNAMHRVRRVIVEAGRRLSQAGILEDPEDVFHLYLDEVRQSIAGRGAERRSLVAQRRAELEHFRAVSPPPMLGMEYGPPPDNPITRTLGKFFGGPPRPTEEPGLLKGNAGSPGKARGKARVIHSLEEAGKLHLGDILVAETTSPPWTPLFTTAGAIVTDTGGILSHCAVVAREYRIPAVVGTGNATKAIRDGQIVEVDGDAGTVRLVESA